MKQIEVSTYGIFPEDCRENTWKLRQMLDQLREEEGIQIIFEPGTYHFYPDYAVEKLLYISNHDEDTIKRIAFDLTGFQHLVIRGEETQFLFHTDVIPFYLHACEDITIEGVKIDYVRPGYSEGKIRELKPQRMDAADLAAYQKKELTVPQLMERYYPTKLMPKVPEEAFRMPKSIAGPEGSITVEKFNVYKEKDEQRPDFGKYKFYAQVGEAKMSAVASRQDLNAYFDRVVTPEKLVERNFGERLHLKSAYEKYRLPEGVDQNGVRVAKDRADNKWKVSVDMGEKGRTTRQEISFDDGYSLFKAKTATREQIAAKYLNTEITGLLAANTAKVEKSASMKM